MPFDWREYLHLANAIRGFTAPGFGTEATARCAVSRAYYSAFCYARAYAIARVGFVPSHNDHRDLRLHLAALGFANIANKLDRLRRWRNISDYDADSIDAAIVPTALAHAREIIDGLP